MSQSNDSFRVPVKEIKVELQREQANGLWVYSKYHCGESVNAVGMSRPRDHGDKPRKDTINGDGAGHYDLFGFQPYRKSKGLRYEDG